MDGRVREFVTAVGEVPPIKLGKPIAYKPFTVTISYRLARRLRSPRSSVDYGAKLFLRASASSLPFAVKD
jgi:hypothetical protein